MSQLRPYQEKLKQDTYKEWQTHRNVLMVLPTGGGKTFTFTSIGADFKAPVVAIAHRQELVGQMSVALGTFGIKHRIIGPQNVIRDIIKLHIFTFGEDFYDPASPVAVAGVDTLINRKEQLSNWCPTVQLWITDEAHHLLKDNKWGKAVAMFPNARGLGVTATPVRADGKGLGAHADGVFQAMVEGPSMRSLIDDGFLTDYRIFAPPSDMDLSEVTISKTTGDYTRTKMIQAAEKSHITGDVVEHYLKLAKGKLGITFAPDIAMATSIAEQFNAAGVPAAVVSSKTPALERAKTLRRFKNRELLQLTNVDLFGEGFDLPAIEVLSMARPTASFGLFVQMFGRPLRLLKGKTHGIIIDHVGNTIRHGLPDAVREWSLDRREKRSSGTPDDSIPVRACPDCTMVYERTYVECPFCGYKPVPAERSTPAMVDGDLVELDAATLAQLRGAVAEVDMPDEEYRLTLAQKRIPQIGQMAQMKRHRLRKEAQHELRDTMALWGGHKLAEGKSMQESQKLFYFKFGIDVMSAQALGDKDATVLNEKLIKEIE